MTGAGRGVLLISLAIEISPAPLFNVQEVYSSHSDSGFSPVW